VHASSLGCVASIRKCDCDCETEIHVKALVDTKNPQRGGRAVVVVAVRRQRIRPTTLHYYCKL
jgi:hypothetical protein